MRPASNLRLFFVAVQYFTRLPVPAMADFDPAWLTASARFFPWVGAVVGLLTALIYLGLAQLLEQPLAALLALLASVIITGAFHEDGLADTFDALGGTVLRERALTIMRDSRIGTYGTLVLLASLMTRWYALASLPLWTAALLLPVIHSAARLGAGSLMMSLAYVRGDDDSAKAKPVAQHLSMHNFFIGAVAVLITLLPCIFLLNRWLMIVAALLISIIVVRTACYFWFKRRLGGYTGDTLGACEQLGEIAVLVALSAVIE